MDLLAKSILQAFPTVVGSAAIAPCLFILWTIASMDNRREPARVVLAAFVLGAASACLLSYVPIQIPGISALSNSPNLQTYVHATLEIAAPEEAAKLLVLIIFCSRFIAYRHPMEGVVYGAAVGLGFAAYENLLYLVTNLDFWRTLAVMRGLLTVPVHGALGVVVGIYVAGARYKDMSRRRRALDLPIADYLTGWGIATGLHGLFDFSVMLQQRIGSNEGEIEIYLLAGSVVVAALASIAAACIIYRTREAQAVSPNSFSTGHRFRSHSWHLTSLVSIVLFLLTLPILGWARQIMRI